MERENYYGEGLQPIDIIDANPYMNFNIANAYKYLIRVGNKSTNKEDIKKDISKIKNYTNNFKKLATIIKEKHDNVNMFISHSLKIEEFAKAITIPTTTDTNPKIALTKMVCITYLFTTDVVSFFELDDYINDFIKQLDNLEEVILNELKL